MDLETKWVEFRIGNQCRFLLFDSYHLSGMRFHVKGPLLVMSNQIGHCALIATLSPCWECCTVVYVVNIWQSPKNSLLNIDIRHPIAYPWGWAMGCLLWIPNIWSLSYLVHCCVYVLWVRSWNNGMRCLSFDILMVSFDHIITESQLPISTLHVETIFL